MSVISGPCNKRTSEGEYRPTMYMIRLTRQKLKIITIQISSLDGLRKENEETFLLTGFLIIIEIPSDKKGCMNELIIIKKIC